MKRQAIDQRMRSFWKLAKSTPPKQSLKDYHVFGVQHLLGSTDALVRALIKAGVPAQNIHLLGKNYSADPLATAMMSARGSDIRLPIFDQKKDAQYLMHELLSTALDKQNAKFIVLDDGGEMLGALAEAINHNGRGYNFEVDEKLIRGIPELNMEPLAKRITGVEQTRRGITVLEELQKGRGLPFSVVNVGQSYGKTKYESVLIGKSVAQSILQKLATLQARGIKGLNARGINQSTWNPAQKPTRVLMLGFGHVGSNTLRFLKAAGLECAVADPAFAASPELRQRAISMGVVPYDRTEQAIGEFGPKVVVSATGHEALNDKLASRLQDGALLFNAASAYTEFPRHWYSSSDNLRLIDIPFGTKAEAEYIASSNVAVGRGPKLKQTFQGVEFDWGQWTVVSQSNRGLFPVPPIGFEYRYGGLSPQEATAFNDVHEGFDKLWKISQLYFKNLFLCPARAPRVLKRNGKELLLVDGGNPINFGGTDPIPPEYIQLTRGLLYLGVMKAIDASSRGPGIYGIPKKPQRNFIHDIQAELRQSGQGSLRRPLSFDLAEQSAK